jgi:hypothetical protein
MLETLTADQRFLIILFSIGIFVFTAIGLQLRKGRPKGDEQSMRREVESFERKQPKEQDPPEDSPFIQLVARVNAIENEQHTMKRDIKNLRVFKSMAQEEEAKPGGTT